jgi:hypothetical protein
MSNENKPDWNDLRNEQAETNAWQIDKIWTTAKKLPIYFWVMFLILTLTMLNTVRLHYAMSDMVKVQFKKTETNRGIAKKYIGNNRELLKGLREQIEHLNTVIEKTQKKNAGMREAIQRKDATIDKLIVDAQKNRNSYLLTKETNLVCLGVAKDDVSKLKAAEQYQTLHTGEPFCIMRWKNADIFASSIISLNARHCAKWVISKKNWESSINYEFHDFLLGMAAELETTDNIFYD